jgi:hypothetical protein
VWGWGDDRTLIVLAAGLAVAAAWVAVELRSREPLVDWHLIVQAVPPTQTGVATGMNTVMRTLGGALGGQLSATFIVDHMSHGLPAPSGFTDTFVMAIARSRWRDSRDYGGADIRGHGGADGLE